MADGDKTFTESEHLAILADRVASETASLTTQLADVTKERDELANKLDVETAARTAAETEKSQLATDFESFKTEQANREAAAARKDDRLTALKGAAPHLGEDYFKDEKRIERIVAMSDEDFEAHKADLEATKPEGFVPPEAPRETAMLGDPAAPAGAGKSHASGVLLGRFGGSTSQIGA